MNLERWQNLDRLFHLALERPPEERSRFLKQACGENQSLLSELESLISAHFASGEFLDAPAYLASSADDSAEFEKPKIGQTVGHYKLLGTLGSGGMGEVYLAQDSRLGRKIALKLLPREFTRDGDRVRRFEHEARAASAMSHPNVCVVHEIGETDDGRRFIAMEHIEGLTLRQRLAEKPVSVSEALEIVMQIAAGLVVTHSAGIIHRDIKPENVMLREDGLVKLLDFGLAKRFTLSTFASADQSTEALFRTDPGSVMGTVVYMSPEQTRGLSVDERTDVWSLGIVLYELLAGQTPFRGITKSDVIAAVLTAKPRPLSQYREDVPEKLNQIVTKALRKQLRERYQTVSEFLNDLKSFRNELELEHISGPTFSAGSTGPAITAGNQAQGGDTNSERWKRTAKPSSPVLTQDTLYLSRSITPRFRAMTIALVGLLVTTGIGFGLYKFLVRHYSPTKPVLFQGIKLLRLSNTGKEKDAVISPDGNYIACVEESAGQESIWLRGVVTTNNNQLVPPAAEQYYGLTFSLDGKYVYYIAKQRNNTIGKLYRVSASGGPSILLVVDVDGPITLSPLGKQMAFVRGSSTGEKALIIALTDGTGEHKLASRNGLEAFSFGGPAWSPDGTIIAVGAANVSGSNRYMSIVGVKVDDGSIRDLTSQKWGGIGRVSWAPDGAGLILAATEYGRKTSSQLWYLSYPGGEARRITNDLDDYDGVSLTALGKVLVTKRTQTLASLWVTPVGDANRSQQVLSSKHDGYNGFFNRFCWMPDGKLIYTAMTNGIPSIWKMKVDGTDQERITLDDHSNSFPSVAPDGHFIIFVSDRMGSNNVWRMDPDGSNLKQLTDGTEESWAQFAPDGRWVVYHRNIEGKRTIWRIPIEGGTPIQVTDYPSNCPVISADGKWICAYYRTEMKGPWRIGIIPFEGGLPVKSFDVPASVVFQSLVRLTPDGSALAYISNREGVSNIWLQPVDGSPAKQLTSFTSEQIFWFDWSLDRKQLALTRGVVSGDVVMISDTGK